MRCPGEWREPSTSRRTASSGARPGAGPTTAPVFPQVAGHARRRAGRAAGRGGLLFRGFGERAGASAASATRPRQRTPRRTRLGPGCRLADPIARRTAAACSVSSPAAGRVRSSWTVPVDGPVYAQPLITGSEVIIATENDTVYALDESTGAVRWSRHLASPVPSGLPCGDVDPASVAGTPVAEWPRAGSGSSRSPASPPPAPVGAQPGQRPDRGPAPNRRERRRWPVPATTRGAPLLGSRVSTVQRAGRGLL